MPNADTERTFNPEANTWGHWTVRKSVDLLREGDRFVFEEQYGGEGEILTALGPANNVFGTREVGTRELDFDLEFYGPAWVLMAVDDDGRMGMTNDIVTCPKCGSRTDYEPTGAPDQEEEHACRNTACCYVFRAFADPEDFDEDGNFIEHDEKE